MDVYKETKEGFEIVLGNKEKKSFGWIIKEGYLKGKTNYFIATEEIIKNRSNPLAYLKKVKWAIYDGNNGKRISQFFDWISPLGLVKGQSNYYRVEKDKKEAIFDLSGIKTEWFDKIRDRGALTGESDYFWGKKNGFYALYCINTGEKLTDDFKSSVLAGAVVGKSNYIVGSYGEEIFFIYDLETKKTVSKTFDEHKLIEILKHGDLEKVVLDTNINN